MKKMLTEMQLTTLSIIEPTLDEAGKPKLPKGVIMQVEAKLGHAGRITANGRLYRKSLMKREVEKIQSRLERRAVHILAGHPKPGENPSPKDLSAALTGLRMEDDGAMVGSLDVIDSRCGRDLAAAARAGVEVGFSSRGPGTAELVKFTDQHEDYSEANADWIGKDVEIVNDDYSLTAYDWVIGQAVEDAVAHSIREDKENVMDFQIEKLTKEQWADILKAEPVSKMVAEAVAQALKDRDEKIVREEAAKAAVEFAEKNYKVEKTDTEPEISEAKCPKCGAANKSGAKFCTECGADMAESKPATPEEKDEAINKLSKLVSDQTKLIEAMQKKIDGMEKDAADKAESEQVAAIVEQVLLGKPVLVVEQARARLADKDMTPDTAEEVATEVCESVEAFVKSLKVDLTEVEPGKGKVKPADADKGKDKTEAVPPEAAGMAVLED